jgi:general stress protein YciG
MSTKERKPVTRLSLAAAIMAKAGASKGGHARAARLSPERRREIGEEGAKARWGPRPSTSSNTDET